MGLTQNQALEWFQSPKNLFFLILPSYLQKTVWWKLVPQDSGYNVGVMRAAYSINLIISKK